MIFAFETLGLCCLMWLICFLGTGSDVKNLKSLHSYPKNLQTLIRKDPNFKDKIKKDNPIITFISNIVMFLIILFLLGIAIRKKGDYLYNFIALLIMGQILNVFDLVIIDICWWRNIKRIRFTGYESKDLYKDVTMHLISAGKAVVMFTIVAAIDAALLMLF